MVSPIRIQVLNVIFLLFFTSLCMAALFMCEGHLGINLNDEAFLWYGATAVKHGEVPIRDFYAYDPGRYYLTASVMKWIGHDGIIASRVAEYLVQGLGLFLSLFMLARTQKFNKAFNFICILIAAVTMLVWMVPLYKSFDVTASIMLIALLVYLIEANTLVAAFWTGVGLSLIAMVGRNHGVYGIVACVSVLIYLSLTTHHYSILSGLKWWLMGILVGYIPIMLMLLFIPGFSNAFFKGIYFLLISKSTNLYLPIPWPWRASTISGYIAGIFFISILLFGVYSLSYVLLTKSKKISSVLIACAFLALPYAHYVFSRADVIHLALGIFPFLIGMFAYFFQLNSRYKIIIIMGMTIFCILSMIVMLPLHPVVQSYKNDNWKYVEITGSQIKVDPDSEQTIEMFKRLIDQYAQNGQSFLVAPFNFGMYSIFDRKSPMWDLYPLFPRSLEDQRADIARMIKANPSFVVIYDWALDGNEERRFHNTHPLIFKYIVSHFELVHDRSETQDVYIYRKKEPDSW